MKRANVENATNVAKAWYITFGFLRASVAIAVSTHPGATQFTRPLGAIFTISFFRVIVSPYIIAKIKHKIRIGILSANLAT